MAKDQNQEENQDLHIEDDDSQEQEQQEEENNNEGEQQEEDGEDEVTLLRRALAEQQTVINTLTDTNQQLTSRINSEPKKKDEPERSKEDLAKEYYEDPVSTVTNIVKRQMEDTVRPLAEEFASYTNNQKYSTIKDAFRNNAVYGKYMKNAQVERLVDALVTGGKVAVDVNAISMVLDNLIGKIATGQLKIKLDDEPTNRGGNKNNNGKDMDIPHHRPSGDGGRREGRNNNTKKDGEDDSKYTETTRRLARIYGMTPQEFTEMNQEGQFIVSSKKKDKKKKGDDE